MMAKKEENMSPRESGRIRTSWRIINPKGVVPVARPMSMVQTTPIVIKVVNTVNTAKSNEEDYDI